MKRSWFGFLLLLALLLGSVLTTRGMDRVHSPIGENLSRAAEFALARDWPQAEAAFRAAEESWKQTENFREFLADHTPVEEIEAGFALLDVYSRGRDALSFAACCAELSAQTRAIGEAHAFVLRNLL